MLARTFIVPAGHGSRWLDFEVLELAFRRREDAPEPLEPNLLPARRSSEPLRYRPFACLEAYFRVARTT